nr:restriction endonuclease subunit S [Neobacillus sp. Marseille-Q6967]
MLIDRYKSGEISLRNFLNELSNLSEIRESKLYDCLSQIDFRRIFDMPNELAQLMTDIALEDNPKSVIDINCSTGKLLSYFPKETVLTGYDSIGDGINIGKFIYPNIELNNQNPIYKDFSRMYDCVVSCLPRGGQIFYEGIEQNTTLVYLKKAMAILKEQGKLVVLISNGFLTAPSSFQMYRDQLLANYDLEMIMNLNTGNFRPNLRDMSLIVIRKSPPTEKVLMPSFANNYDEIKQFYFGKSGFAVESARLIGSRWDPHFYDPRFKKIDEKLKNKDVKKLEEIANILSGPGFRGEERLDSGKYLIVRPGHIQNGELNLFTENQYIDDCSQDENVCILQPGDMITPLVNNSGELYIYKETDPPAIASRDIAIIRSANNEYIKTYLHTKEGKKLYSLQVDRKSRGVPQSRRLTVRDIKNIRIPLLPLDNLNVVSDKGIESATQSELLELKEKIVLLREKYKHEKSRNRELNDLANNRYEKILQAISINSSSMSSLNQRMDEFNEKVSYLIDLVSDMEKDIKQIKLEGKNELEVIQNIMNKIDSAVNQITLETYDTYVEKTKEWIVPHWDKLHDLSKRMLPSADMLFDNITRLENSDPSPFILQYCRSLENELRIKIFVAYLHDLKLREVDLMDQFSWDFEINESGLPYSRNSSSYEFAMKIKELLEKDENHWHFELGRMSTFLKKITGRTVRRSPILQDFKEFILRYFEENFVDTDLFEKIMNVTRVYRNRAAHPNEISFEEAIEGKEIIKELILSVLRNYKETK